MKKIKNYSRFYALLKKLHGADKEQLVSAFTNGRTTSLRDMTPCEYREMCDRLQGVDADAGARKRWRHIVLSSLSAMGIVVRGNDYTDVDNYCMDKRIAGKRFAALSVEELKALNKKLFAIKLGKSFVPKKSNTVIVRVMKPYTQIYA
jgi:hypothetical protein